MFDYTTSLPYQRQRIDVPTMVSILEVVQETPFVKTFTLDISLNAQPGQFVNIWLPRIDEKPFSVAYDDGNTLKITFFAVGDFSKQLFEKQVGDKIGIRGPYGTAYTWEKDTHLALVAGGYGAAPMYFVAKKAIEDGCHLNFIVGGKSADYLLYLNPIAELPQTFLHIATNDGSKGHKGYNTEVLEQILQKRYTQQVFACGPEMMLYSVFRLCEQYEVPGKLSMERYMKCSFGVCGQCVMDNTADRVCMEGAVMTTEQLARIEEFGHYHRDKQGLKHFF